ncbi:MAG: LptF/LptG family permease [Tepidisphaeraceae bacterium]
MSKTLFWYVFKQLLSVFGLASGVIAGIMSFGGLLKPLMNNGLDLGQVGKMLAYAMPAMTTYSYPIAALFSCTVVYGRLAADNEVTAVRAAGISMGPLGLGFPALVLGLIVSSISLALLSFMVPAASMRVERTVVSNLGQIVVSRITQQHQVRLVQSSSQGLTIFARTARLAPSDPKTPDEQVVNLEGVSIVTYSKAQGNKLQVPEEFYLAKQVEAHIQQKFDPETEEVPVQMLATLTDGLKFPRTTTNREDAALQGGVQTYQFGPLPLQSPLRENTKFMDIRKLQDLRTHPENSQRMQDSLEELIRADQENQYLQSIITQLTTGLGVAKFKTTGGDQYTLIAATPRPTIDKDRLVLTTTPQDTAGIRLIQTRGGDLPSIESSSKAARIRVYPDNDNKELSMTIELLDTVIRENGEESARLSFERNFTIPMPEAIHTIADRTVKEYMRRTDLPPDQRAVLWRNLMKQNNSVISEMHSRVSFALSCIVLTLVGYGLGVMFKSGNYLNAFAVSVVPAIVSIVLIVTGQHICENVPPNMGPHFQNPLNLGLFVLWAGNVAVLIIAIGLLVRLRRQ